MVFHAPVLKKEVLQYLEPGPNQNFIDCTIGEGGYSIDILKLIKPEGRVLGIDWDQNQIENCKNNLGENLQRAILVPDNFSRLKAIVEKYKFYPVKGILLDLGMSSWHLEGTKRGFSFLRDEPLDMRYGKEAGDFSARDIVNKWKETEIEKILREYGQERFSQKIAKEIVKSRRRRSIETTFQLKELIKKAIPARFWRGRIHFATRTFQALRIAVNDELENIKKVLPQALDVLEPGGAAVVISFHSLEDRIVKNFFKESAKEKKLKILTKKPIIPSKEEINLNPRARSAKLRAAEKI